jgi:hypothetical protein
MAQLLPQNQINALPTLTVAQAQAADTVQVVGGSITKNWIPQSTGVNGAQATADGVGAGGFIATNYLDLTGCKFITLITTRVPSDASAQVALGTANTFLQYRLNKSDSPPTFRATGAFSVDLGMRQIQSTGADMTFPAIAAGDISQRLILMWSPSSQVGTTATEVPVMIGSDVRILVHWAVLPPAINIFSMTVWANS